MLYAVYWHVKDNPETYPHNDSMLVIAKDEYDAIEKAYERIDDEFDYGVSDVDMIECRIYDNAKYI